MSDPSKEVPILILGARGFVGSSLTRHLNNRGYKTITPSSQECDLLSKEQTLYYFSSLTTPVRIVFCARVTRQKENSFQSMLENIQMVQSLKESILPGTVNSIVYLSSADVYGFPLEAITEKTTVCPRGYYGLGKFVGEVILGMLSPLAIPVTTLRLPGIYGPGDGQQSVVGQLYNQLICTGRVTIYGDGETLRDYVEVEDVCSIVEHFIEWPLNEILNIVTGKSISINEMVSLIAKEMGLSPNIVYQEIKQRAHNNLVFCHRNVTERIPGFSFVSIAQGIAKYVNDFRKADKKTGVGMNEGGK